MMRTAGSFGRFITVRWDFDDLAVGFTPAIQLPLQSQVLRGALVVLEASNAGTTDTISVGTAASPAANLAATTVRAVATTDLTSLAVANGAVLGLTRATTGAAPTVGKYFVFMEYINCEFTDFIVGDLAGQI